MNRIARSATSMLLATALMLFPAMQAVSAETSYDDSAPEVVGITLDKQVLKPDEIGTYTIRLKDDNPPNENTYLSWSTQAPTFPWSYETIHQLHNGNAVPGSFTTDADGITSFKVQFRVLKNSPYGSYENTASITLSDTIGNYTLASLPGFHVDDPAHPIDNTPTLQGTPQVGQEMKASLNAPGATVTHQWYLGGSGSTNLVGSEDHIYLQHKWYWSNLELRSTATWPDGHQLLRTTDTGNLEPITVDAGTLAFTPAPRVGVESEVVFTPNPDLPFTIAPDDILILSTADLQPVKSKFTPFPADEGKSIYARAHLNMPAGYIAREEVTARTIIQPGTWAIGTPRILGNAVVGKTLSTNLGTWAGNPDGFMYQWFRNGVPLTNEVFGEYTVTPADVGASLTVKATAFWSNRQSRFSATSSAATPVKGTLPAIDVSVQGSAKVGKKLTASATGWLDDTSLKYQWLRDGQAITGATAASYQLAPSDYTKSVAVKVTASRTGYNSRVKTSTAKTIAAGTLTKGTVAVTGSAKVGKKLTASSTGWTTGSKLSYQWMRDGKAIKSAVNNTYQLVATDYAKKISVKVTASKFGYSKASVTSVSKTIAKGTLAVGKVQIVGTPKVAQTLKARTTAWSSGSTLKYQWLRNGKAISTATKASYKLTAKDRKTKISVKVRASKPGYTTTKYVTSAYVNIK